jgi:DNA polymerase
LHEDYETRSKLDLRKVGVHRYAADPSTEIRCVAYAVDDGPVQTWLPGDPVPPERIEAARNPIWVVARFGDHFETAIDQHILAPRHGWPLVPLERHRCVQAMALAVGLPAKLETLADELEFANRKDRAGARLMQQMAKPRRPHKNENPNDTYWFDDPERNARLRGYNVQDVEVEREAHNLLPLLSPFEQSLWQLSCAINEYGFCVDRRFAKAARQIAQAAVREIDAELTEITGGIVSTIDQIARLKTWLAERNCLTESLDKKAIEKLLHDDTLAPQVRRVLELRLGGAQAAVKKIMRYWLVLVLTIASAGRSAITALLPVAGPVKDFCRRI